MIRRSIGANNYKNKKITEQDIKYARPGNGFATYQSNQVIGKKASKNIKPETIISKSMLTNVNYSRSLDNFNFFFKTIYILWF